MNYEYFKTFYYVGKHKSFSKAAAVLYTSQPAITRTIQKLERELGCLLFVRSKAGVEFTHEGELLFRYVSAAHSQLMKGENEVGKAAGIESGTIYIGSTITALQMFLLEFLDRFHAEHPGIKFKITTGSTNGTIEKLKNGTVDLAFVSTPCVRAKSMVQTPILQFNDILISGNNYPHLKNKLLPLQALQDYPYVCLIEGMQLREFIDEFFDEHALSITPDIELDSADMIVPLVTHGFGIGFVPSNMTQKAILRGEVFRVQLEQELPPRQLCMITDPHHPHTRASRELTQAILRSIGK